DLRTRSGAVDVERRAAVPGATLARSPGSTVLECAVLKRVAMLLVSMAGAALTPLFAGHEFRPSAHAQAREWPHEFRGHPLVRVPLNLDEQRFLEDFPGVVARFTDGEHDILMRWVDRPTRRLHPAEDCYRGW